MLVLHATGTSCFQESPVVVNNGECTGCPAQTYKSAVGSGNCTACPEHSVTDSEASVTCRCEDGLDSHLVDGRLVRCSGMSSSVVMEVSTIRYQTVPKYSATVFALSHYISRES